MMNENTTGRLCPEEWDDAEPTDVRPIALPPYYFATPSALEVPSVGNTRAVLANDSGVLGTLAWDATAEQPVDLAELDARGWVP